MISTVRPTGELTVRETQILRLIRDGLTNQEIAEELDVREDTVSHHVTSLVRKLGAGSRDQITRRPVKPLPAPPAADTGEDVDWRTRAACAGMDGEIWFPVGSTGPAAHQIEKATAICSTCPAMFACRQWAHETRQMAGIWGGQTEDERQAIFRRHARNRARSA